MKKILSLLLSLVMCLTLLPTVTLAAETRGQKVEADELEITNQNIDFGTVSHGDDVSALKRTVTVTNTSDRSLYYPFDNQADYFNQWESDLFDAKGDLMGRVVGYNFALAELKPGESADLTVSVNKSFMNMKSGRQSYTYYLKFASEEGKRYLETLVAPVDGYTKIVDTTVYTTFPITMTINIDGEAKTTKTRGVAVTDDEFTISATTIDFGTVPYGKACADQYITVTNTSDRRLYIQGRLAQNVRVVKFVYLKNVTQLDPGESVKITARAETDTVHLSDEEVKKLPLEFKCEDEFYISSKQWEMEGGWTSGAVAVSGTLQNDNYRTYKLTAKVKVAPAEGSSLTVKNSNLTIEKDLGFTVEYTYQGDKTGNIVTYDWKPEKGATSYKLYSDYFTVTNGSDFNLKLRSSCTSRHGSERLNSGYIYTDMDTECDLKPGESIKARFCLELPQHFYSVERASQVLEKTTMCTLSGYYFNANGKIKDAESQTVCVNIKLNMTNKTVDNQPKEKPSSWAEAEVTEAINAKLVPSALQSKYTQATTRAEFCALATALYETAKGKEITERATFTDTSDLNVQKMAGLGVVNGVGNNRFDPSAQLTREQAATMLARLANVMGKPMAVAATNFADNAQISSWAKDAVGQVQAAGVMNGVGNNMFSPKTNYTREQSILTILRTFHYVK